MKTTLTGALVALTALASLTACSVEETSTSTSDSADTTTTATDADASAPKYTLAQENAIASAESYLSMGGYSRRGLIEQLASPAGEGFKRANAVFAVNHVKVNWNQQAVESAKSYMEMGGYSRSGLIDQLSSSAGEQFTRAQAEYAAKQVGY